MLKALMRNGNFGTFVDHCRLGSPHRLRIARLGESPKILTPFLPFSPRTVEPPRTLYAKAACVHAVGEPLDLNFYKILKIMEIGHRRRSSVAERNSGGILACH